MIVYSDAVGKHSGIDIFDALLAIARSEFGDTIHHSGRADYLIRLVGEEEDRTVREPVENYFMMAANGAMLELIAKIGAEEPDLIGSVERRDNWIELVSEAFRGFRRQLDESR